ncbi:penicillin-binding protein [Solitalea longa]|uniref:Penicillin-binding protein n=1 Tax=Solitalea longa TaxID=2079460 RepID=A0A2S4ZZT4_9SPHI|nr:serine hydrolase [Solitalea longa]POY35868.1 penicillin-binding protein [Solitalea longa]
MTAQKSLRNISLLLFVAAIWLASCSHAHVRSTSYFYSPPKSQNDGIAVGEIHKVNIDSAKIIELTTLILKDTFPNIHSLLICKDDKLVYENYFSGKDENWGHSLGYAEHGTNTLHDIRSISKSVVAACIDIAIQQKKIKSIDDPIFNYLPNYIQLKTNENQGITIRHLLTMSSGIKWDEDVPHGTSANDETNMERSGDPVKYVLSSPMATKPGQIWKYNSGGVQVLAEIIRSVSGDNVDKFAEKYLFEPLGIRKYEWTKSHRKFPAAASGLRLSSRDLLKFGLLYLNNGKWNGKQLLTENWVNETFRPQIIRDPNEPTKGYSFLFWTQIDSVNNKDYSLIAAKGNGGQRIFINKANNLVVVLTAGNYNKSNITNDGQMALDKFILAALR